MWQQARSVPQRRPSQGKAPGVFYSAPRPRAKRGETCSALNPTALRALVTLLQTTGRFRVCVPAVAHHLPCPYMMASRDAPLTAPGSKAHQTRHLGADSLRVFEPAGAEGVGRRHRGRGRGRGLRNSGGAQQRLSTLASGVCGDPGQRALGRKVCPPLSGPPAPVKPGPKQPRGPGHCSGWESAQVAVRQPRMDLAPVGGSTGQAAWAQGVTRPPRPGHRHGAGVC